MIDFESLYSQSNIETWGLQAPSSLDPTGRARGLVIRWSKIKEQFNQIPNNSFNQLYFFSCDVLIFDEDPMFDENLIIFARQIQCVGSININVKSTAKNITIVCQEIVKAGTASSVNLVFYNDPPFKNVPVTLSIPSENPAATVFSLTAAMTITTKAWKSSDPIETSILGYLIDGQPLRLSVTTEFQLAVLLSETHLSLAIDQLRWLAAITDVNPSTRTMSGQARTELGRLYQKQQGIIPIPPLDFSVYSQAANNRITLLKERNDNYNKFIDLERSNDQWLAQAKMTLALEKNEQSYASNLENRAKDSLTNAMNALNAAIIQLNSLKQAFTSAKFKLDAGIKIWARKETIKASVELVQNIAKLGYDVGSLIVGAGSAASGDSEKKDSGDKKKKTAAQVTLSSLEEVAGQVTPLVSDIGSVVGNVKQIIDISNEANSLGNTSQSTLKGIENGLDQTFSSEPLSGINYVTGGKQVWESLSISMASAFKKLSVISEGVAFHDAFKQLVLGAESYCDARLEVAHARNLYADSQLRTKAAESAVDIVKNYGNELAKNDALYQQLQIEAYGKVLDAKRAIYLELLQYSNACRYFTLKNPPSLPSITAPVDQYIETSSNCSGYELVLNQLNPLPQPMQKLEVTVPVSEEQCSDDGQISARVDIKTPALSQNSRVRLDNIAFELFDENGNKITVDSLSVLTNGVYFDRDGNGETMRFVGNPWKILIEYQNGIPVVSGSIYNRLTNLIFKPTPFTSWLITIKNSDGTVNIGKAQSVKKITFIFSGEASALTN